MMMMMMMMCYYRFSYQAEYKVVGGEVNNPSLPLHTADDEYKYESMFCCYTANFLT